MDLMTSDDLKALIEKRGETCVSIYMPAHRGGQDIPQDKIRFRNLLKEAEDRLLATGHRGDAAREVLAPAEELLLNDSLFWAYQDTGLAIFLSPGFFRPYRLAMEFQESVILGSRFYIKPLIPLAIGEARFYVLALGQKHLRLFQGTRYGLREMGLEGVPKSMAEALKYDERGKELQFQTRTGERKGGERAGVFFVHGSGGELEKDNLLRYFHQINAGLHESLREKREPLILAGVEYLFPIYRQANTYAYLLDEGIPGNPEEQRPDELHKQAWAIMEPYFMKAQEEAVARHGESTGTGLASNDLKEIVPAAHYGRVQVLFVANGAQQWGTFDPDANGIGLHEEAEPGDEDLLDLAAAQTLRNGGSVYAMEPDRVPGGPPAAAVFRY